MIQANQLRFGKNIELDGTIYTVVEFQHVKPGKGGAFIHTKLKNLETGAIIDKTFRSEEKIEEVILEDREAQFLYKDESGYYFMEMKTFEQLTLSEEEIGDKKKFLAEGLELGLVFYKNKPIGIELPIFVELVISQTEPGIKGDTVTNVMKEAVLETGEKIQVPLFVKSGDKIKIDTRTGEYISRA